MTKFVAIVSAKGGVGKTTTSINISSALDWFRREVIVLDANFDNPDIGLHLGAELMEKTLHSALKGEHHIRDSIYLHPSGLKIIPGNISYYEARKAKKENLSYIFNDLIGAAEVVIVDSSPGLDDNTRSVMNAVDYIIIVTTPDVCSVSNSLRTVKLAEELNKEVLGIIVTRVENDPSELDTKNIEVFLKRKVIGSIPNDPCIKKANAQRNPVVFLYPNSPAATGFKKVAAELIGEKYVEQIEREEDNSLFRLGLRAFGLGK